MVKRTTTNPCPEALVYEMELVVNDNVRYASAVRAVACLAGTERLGADLNLLRREDLHCLLEVLADGFDRQTARMDNLLGQARGHAPSEGCGSRSPSGH